MAESLFRHKVQQAGLGDYFQIDSAGTGNWHQGQNPDRRTLKVLAQNGILEFSKARQVRTGDFSDYDHVIAMDEQNVRDLHQWKGAVESKVSLMMGWKPLSTVREVPDPYYGEEQDFEEVYDLLDGATGKLLDQLVEIHDLPRTL